MYEIKFTHEDGTRTVGGYSNLEDCLQVARLYEDKCLAVSIMAFTYDGEELELTLEEADLKIALDRKMAEKSTKFNKRK